MFQNLMLYIYGLLLLKFILSNITQDLTKIYVLCDHFCCINSVVKYIFIRKILPTVVIHLIRFMKCTSGTLFG